MICPTCNGNKGYCKCVPICTNCGSNLVDPELAGGGTHDFGEMPDRTPYDLRRAGVLHYRCENCRGSSSRIRDYEFMIYPNGDTYNFKWELYETNNRDNRNYGWMKVR